MRTIIVLLLLARAALAQHDRIVSNDPKQCYPRWLPVTNLVAPAVIGGGGGGTGGGGVVPVLHPDLEVDRTGVVHMVKIGASGINPAVLYLTNDAATRHETDFNNGFPVFTGGVIGTDDLGHNILQFPTSVAMALDSQGNVHVVWAATTMDTVILPGHSPLALSDVYYRKLTRSGASIGWSATVKLTTGTADPSSSDIFDAPAIAVDKDDKIHIVWRHSQNVAPFPGTPTFAEFQYVKEFGTPQPVPGSDPTAKGIPVVRVDPSLTVHLGWRKDPTNLHYTTITGVTLSSPALIATDAASFSMDADGAGKAHFVWSNTASEVLYQRFGVTGVSKVNTTPGHSPVIVVDSRNRPHVLWTAADAATDPDLGGPASVPAYASIVDNPAVPPGPGGLPWSRQEPIVDLSKQGALLVTSAAVSRNDVVHVGFSKGEYTRQQELNLGEQDAFGMLNVGPGLSANVMNGNVLGLYGAFSSRGKGFATALSFTYNSHEEHRGLISPGWSHNYAIRIIDHKTGNGPAGTNPEKDLITLILGDGPYIIFRFRSTLGYHVAEDEFGYFSKIERLSPGYSMRTKFGIVYTFNGRGVLVEIRDTHVTANIMTFEYSTNDFAENAGELVRIFLREKYREDFPEVDRADVLRQLIPEYERRKNSGVLQPAPELDEIVKVAKHPSEHYSKMIANLFPLFSKLCTGPDRNLLSPQDPDEEQLSWETLDRQQLVVYFYLGTNADVDRATAVGRMALLDLQSYLGGKYAYMPSDSYRPINIYVDELHSILTEEFISVVNQARGAAFRITMGSQSFADLEHVLRSKAAARRVLGNANILFQLHVEEEEDAEMFASRCGRRLVSLTQKSVGYEPGFLKSGHHSVEDFRSTLTNSETLREVTLVPPWAIQDLPVGHYFARWGGIVYKGRVPFLPEPTVKESELDGIVRGVFRRAAA